MLQNTENPLTIHSITCYYLFVASDSRKSHSCLTLKGNIMKANTQTEAVTIKLTAALGKEVVEVLNGEKNQKGKWKNLGAKLYKANVRSVHFAGLKEFRLPAVEKFVNDCITLTLSEPDRALIVTDIKALSKEQKDQRRTIMQSVFGSARSNLAKYIDEADPEIQAEKARIKAENEAKAKAEKGKSGKPVAEKIAILLESVISMASTDESPSGYDPVKIQTLVKQALQLIK